MRTTISPVPRRPHELSVSRELSVLREVAAPRKEFSVSSPGAPRPTCNTLLYTTRVCQRYEPMGGGVRRVVEVSPISSGNT